MPPMIFDPGSDPRFVVCTYGCMPFDLTLETLEIFLQLWIIVCVVGGLVLTVGGVQRDL